MLRTFRHVLASSVALVTLGAGILTVVPASAGAATTSPVSVVVKHGDGYINAIRTYVFCTSATCKKNKSANEASATSSMATLLSVATTAQKARVGSKYRTDVNLLLSDVKALQAVFTVFGYKNQVINKARNEGEIYYDTATIGSDIYLLSALQANKTPAFADWSIGIVATLYAMQIDSQALASKNDTAAGAVYASECLEAEANQILGHLNGPVVQYNSLLSTFAHNQITVSKSEITDLEGGKGALNTSEISAHTKVLASEFAQIVKLQNQLVKAKA